MKLLLILVMLLSLCGCSMKEENADIFAMDTIITLKAYGKNADIALSQMREEIYRLDEKFSPDSEIIGDHETEYIINTADEVSALTDGAFNIRMGEVMALWGFHNKAYKVPTASELEAALITEKLDFGGIAKGYAGDRLFEIAKNNGVKSAILTLGGNVVAIGKKPDGTLWKVGISDPENPNDYIGFVEVSDKSVITSGGYQRYFEEDGKTYHHIIDPKTGFSADSGLSSVTVIAEDGILADALSTACFVLGKDRTLELYNSQKLDFEAILVEDDDNIITTDNINFTKR